MIARLLFVTCMATNGLFALVAVFSRLWPVRLGALLGLALATVVYVSARRSTRREES